MATIKAYSDLQQSKKLAEILPLESADMYYMKTSCNNYTTGVLQSLEKDMLVKAEYYKMFACWSLSALLDVLPNNKHIETTISRGGWKIDSGEYLPNTWWCEYEDTKNQTEFNISADNPVDACVVMIEKLHELNLL